jgi:ribosomal protein L11 methylase PrmA
MTPDVGELMHKDTVLLASGIILERSDDVVECFEKHGFCIVERLEENGWCGLAVMKK